IKPEEIKRERNRKVYFSILPLSTEIPGGGRALITSTTAGFYLGDRKTAYLSTATVAPYFDFKGRFGLPLRTSIWLKDNSWNIRGDTRLRGYPECTWGLGSGRAAEDTINVDDNYLGVYHR